MFSFLCLSHRWQEAEKEVRPVGRYTSSPPGAPHREGGGTEGAVVFYSFRGEDGVFLGWLDDTLNIVATTGMKDFVGLFKEQKNA